MTTKDVSSTPPENAKKPRDGKRLRDLFTPLLDLDEDTVNLQNLDKMLADRFAHFAERRKQLQAMKDVDERQLVIKMLDEKKAAAAAAPSHPLTCEFLKGRHNDLSFLLVFTEHQQEEGVSDELKHLKDE